MVKQLNEILVFFVLFSMDYHEQVRITTPPHSEACSHWELESKWGLHIYNSSLL